MHIPIELLYSYCLCFEITYVIFILYKNKILKLEDIVTLPMLNQIKLVY